MDPFWAGVLNTHLKPFEKRRFENRWKKVIAVNPLETYIQLMVKKISALHKAYYNPKTYHHTNWAVQHLTSELVCSTFCHSEKKQWVEVKFYHDLPSWIDFLEFTTQVETSVGPRTSFKWSFNSCKWPYKWVTGGITTFKSGGFII